MAITVTAAAESRKLTTLADFKAMMNITDTDAARDTFIGKIIDRVSQAIVTFCGTEFAKETVQETFAGSGNPIIFLSRTPIVTLTSITDDGENLTAEDFELQDKKQGRIYNKSGFWRYTGYLMSYVAVYTAGYVLPSFGSGTVDLPEDIQAAALELTKMMYLGRSQDTSVASETIPDVYSVEYGFGPQSAGKLLTSNSTIQDLLSSYRRYKI